MPVAWVGNAVAWKRMICPLTLQPYSARWQTHLYIFEPYVALLRSVATSFCVVFFAVVVLHVTKKDFCDGKFPSAKHNCSCKINCSSNGTNGTNGFELDGLSEHIFSTQWGEVCILPNRPTREDNNPEVHKWRGEVVPLLIEALALLLNAGLDPGRDIVTELGQGLVLRGSQAAVVLWRVWTGEGLEVAALGATHGGILQNALLYMEYTWVWGVGSSKALLCSPPRLLRRSGNGDVTDRRLSCGWAGESSSHCWTCAGLSRGCTGTWPSWISPWCKRTFFCQRDSPRQTSAAVKTCGTWFTAARANTTGAHVNGSRLKKWSPCPSSRSFDSWSGSRL